jgi:hypothetical protein
MAHTVNHSRSAQPIESASFDIERPSWAPQFLPESTTTAHRPVQTGALHKESRPSSQSQSSQIKALWSQDSSDYSTIQRNRSQFFPVSAFLACPDPSGRYPSKSKFLGEKPTKKGLQRSESSATSTSSFKVQEATINAAHRALTSQILQANPTSSTDKSDTQQKDPTPPSVLAHIMSAPGSFSVDSAMKSNTSSTMFEPTCGPAPPTTYGFGREPPFLDAERTKINPRFHSRWQRPSMPAPTKPSQSNAMAESGHTLIMHSTHVADVPAKPHARCYFPRQPGRKSRFFANGRLIAHDTTSAAQQSMIRSPASACYKSSAGTISHTPTTSKSSPHSFFRDSYEKLTLENAWNTYHSQRALSRSSTVLDVTPLRNVNSHTTQKNEDSISQCSPPRAFCRLNPNSSTEDKRTATIPNIHPHLNTDLDESVSNSDSADYDIVSPLFEYDVISPVTPKSIADSWDKLPAPRQPDCDVESIDESDCDDEDDEYYYEPYYPSH